MTVHDDTIGLIGAGRMGRQLGRFLLQAGWPVVAYDPQPAGPAELAAAGATVAADVAGAARGSRLVLVVVVDDAQVEEVVAGPGGALAAAAPGTTVAVCTSVAPETCRRLAASGAERGIAVIDAALVGGERGAEAGELLVLCGGDEAAIDRARPPLAAFSRAVVRVGGSGAGMVAKMVNNLLLWACLRADYEALVLGKALGVEPAALRVALAHEGSGANRPLAEWGEHRLRWPAKDLEQALQVAAAAGVELPFVGELPRLMAQLTVEDLGELL